MHFKRSHEQPSSQTTHRAPPPPERDDEGSLVRAQALRFAPVLVTYSGAVLSGQLELQPKFINLKKVYAPQSISYEF